MGYRIDITDVVTKTNYYGTKHYGYAKCGDEHQLESFKYLVSIGKMKGDEYFEYGCENACVLNAEQFRRFIELYNKEYMSGFRGHGHITCLKKKN